MTVGQIADLVGGRVVGDPNARVSGLAPLDRAGPRDLSIFTRRRFLGAYQTTSAGAVLVADRLAHLGAPTTLVTVADPLEALCEILIRVEGERGAPAWGVDPTARIEAGVQWAGRIAIGQHVRIGSETRFGAECVIEAGATIGRGVRFGDRAVIGAGASVGDGVQGGDAVIIGPGARIGTTGFGFTRGGQRIPHPGTCRLGTAVEIGANATIDRGSVGDTEIGEATKIDNLVHVGHNVRIGRHCVLLAQVGIAGSVDIDDEVAIGGQAGVAGHLRIGRGARLAAQAGVIGDVAEGRSVSGYPARDHRSVLRQTAWLRRMDPRSEGRDR